MKFPRSFLSIFNFHLYRKKIFNFHLYSKKIFNFHVLSKIKYLTSKLHSHHILTFLYSHISSFHPRFRPATFLILCLIDSFSQSATPSPSSSFIIIIFIITVILKSLFTYSSSFLTVPSLHLQRRLTSPTPPPSFWLYTIFFFL